jgi:hypothetical protein
LAGRLGRLDLLKLKMAFKKIENQHCFI